MKTHLLCALVCALHASTAAGASLCETGRNQSPIDIRQTQRKPLANLSFDYPAAALQIANDGHSARVRFANNSQLLIGNTPYALEQFHFHTPAGDRIAGEEFPFAAHLLHKSRSGQLLAVVVLFRLGASNPLLDKLLPLIPATMDGTHQFPNAMLSASDLIPAQKGYYRYTGSLTSAPCTEGVDWVVLKQPLELSALQLASYKARFADNGRKPQALNQRVVLESE